MVATSAYSTSWVTQLSWMPSANAGVPLAAAALQKVSSSVHVVGGVRPALSMACWL